MKSAKQEIGVVTCAAILLVAGRALAQDWPQWRGSNRDGRVLGSSLPATWPQQFTQNWKVNVGGGVDSTPALVGNRLYVFARQGGDEVMLCLDAETGRQLWSDKYACPAVTGPSAPIHPGPRSSPAVAGGKVVTLGVTGIVSCYEIASGKLVWRKDDFPGAYPVFYTGTSPLIVDDTAIVQIGGTGNGGIVAYDLASGAQKWKWTDDGPAYGSPALMTVQGVRQVVTLTDKMLAAVNLANGKLLWQIPFAPAARQYNAATPIIDGQTVFITGQGRGTKAIRIDKQGEAFTVTDLWTNPQVAVQWNTPVLKNGFLYGLSDRGSFFCLNAKTGETAWMDSVRRQNFAAILDAGSVLLGLTQDGMLSVFQPDDKAYTEVASIKVADLQTYAHPVLAGNRLFVRDQDSVILWIIK